jgi:hypothetical protein
MAATVLTVDCVEEDDMAIGAIVTEECVLFGTLIVKVSVRARWGSEKIFLL